MLVNVRLEPALIVVRYANMIYVNTLSLISRLEKNNEFIAWFVNEYHDNYKEFVKAVLDSKKANCGACLNKWCIQFLMNLTDEQKTELNTKLPAKKERLFSFEKKEEMLAFLANINDESYILIRPSKTGWLLEVRDNFKREK